MKKSETAWVVVYMSQRRDEAQRAMDALAAEGFLVRMYPEGAESASGAFEIKCLQSEAREARDLLVEKGFA